MLSSFLNLRTFLFIAVTALLAPTLSAQNLEFYVTADSDVAAPGERLTYMMTVANTGSVNLTDVSVLLQRPESITGFVTLGEGVGCSSNGTCTWTVGILEPGASRQVGLFTSVRSDATPGIITMDATASATGASDEDESVDVLIEPSSLLRLSLAPGSGPAEPGEPFTYKIAYGNVGSSTPTNVVLRAWVPSGASFESASGGGVESGGVVTWNLATVGVGGSGQVRFTVTPSAGVSDGDVLEARAELDPGVATAAVVTAEAVTPVHESAPLAIEVGVSQSAVGQSDRVIYTLTATNVSTVNQTDVDVRALHPQFTSGFTTLGESFGCSSNQTCRWTVGTLAPGESRQVSVFTSTRNDAPQGDLLQVKLIGRASSGTQVTGEQDVLIDPTPLLRLSLAPESGPAEPDESFTYTLAYGNVGSNSPSDVVLRAWVPSGASFASASGGGAESGGVVTWNLGTVGVGANGQVRLTVVPDAALSAGDVLRARAELNPGVPTAATVRASAVTPVRADTPLRIRVGVSQSAVGQGDRLLYILTAANTSTVNLTDVDVRVLHPQFTSGFTTLGENFGCSSNQTCRWSIGTLAPGESRQVGLFTSLRADAPQGDLLRTVLLGRSSTGSAGHVSAAQDVLVDPVPLLRLSLAPDSGPAEPGEPFTYTLTFSNVGSSNPSDVVLRAWMPEGARFDAASGGGIEAGGVVTWNLGTLGVGASGQVRLTVVPDGTLSDGDVLEARAELDPGAATAAVVRASSVTVIRTNAPLEVQVAVSQSAVGQGDRLTYTLTAANTSTVNLTDVVVRVLHPQFTSGWTTLGENFGCSSNQTCQWTIGTLAPGESRQVGLFTSTRANAPQGDLLRTVLLGRSSTGTAGQVSAAQDVLVDPTPLLRLSLAPDPAPAEPDEAFTYRLTFGNVGSTSPSDVVLRMPLPEGTTLTSATCGAQVADGVVWWDLGTVAVGDGGQFFATVTPDATLASGRLLEARAEIDPGMSAAAVVRSSSTTPVSDDLPLEITFVANTVAAGPGERVSYDLTATNTGAVNLNNVLVRLQHPRFTTGFNAVGGGFGCSSNQTCQWNLGTLSPGQTETLELSANLRSDAPAGDILRSRVITSATGSWQRALHEDVVSGPLGNYAPMRASITSPADGAPFLIGGGDGEDPARADSAFVVEWAAACDPENDAVTYRWQLSASNDFGSLLLDEPSATGGTATQFAAEFGVLADVLDNLGVALGESTTLYHRVVTHDGENQAFGDVRSLILSRGTIVGVEEASDLPTRFALHGNYPNPFNPATTFTFDLPEAADVDLTVFDGLGRRVATVVAGRHPAGTFRYVWEAGHLPSGIYVYRLEAGTYASTRKLILLK